jgi:hypothetical protein
MRFEEARRAAGLLIQHPAECRMAPVLVLDPMVDNASANALTMKSAETNYKAALADKSVFKSWTEIAASPTRPQRSQRLPRQ